MVSGSSSTDDEKLIILNGSKAVVDFYLRNLSLMKKRVRYLSDFREEAVIVIDFNIIGFLNVCVHIQI